MPRFAISLSLSFLVASLGFAQAGVPGAHDESSSASSSESAGVLQDPVAMNIVTGSLAKMGSSTTAMDSSAEETMTLADGSTASVTIKSRGTDRLRRDIDFGSHQISYVVGAGYKLENGTKQNLPLHVTAYERSSSRFVASGSDRTSLGLQGCRGTGL
jgi:hypothetical protein